MSNEYLAHLERERYNEYINKLDGYCEINKKMISRFKGIENQFKNWRTDSSKLSAIEHFFENEKNVSKMLIRIVEQLEEITENIIYEELSNIIQKIYEEMTIGEVELYNKKLVSFIDINNRMVMDKEEEEKRIKEEAEKRKIEEDNRKRKEEADRRKREEEKRRKAEADAKRKADDEKRIKEEEIKRIQDKVNLDKKLEGLKEELCVIPFAVMFLLSVIIALINEHYGYSLGFIWVFGGAGISYLIYKNVRNESLIKALDKDNETPALILSGVLIIVFCVKFFINGTLSWGMIPGFAFFAFMSYHFFKGIGVIYFAFFKD